MDKKLMNSIIDGIPVVLFVVDKNYRMKFVNSRFAEVFCCENAQDSNGQVGRMINCATLKDGGTCTQEELCNFCTLKRAFVDCIVKGRDVYHRIIEKNVVINGKQHVISLKLTMNAMQNGDYVCVVDDVSEIIEISERERQMNKELLKELSKATNIQKDLLPKNIDVRGMDFAYIYKQLSGIGGDFFNIYRIDDSHAGMYIADVSGHGVSGGMLTVFLSENFNKQLTSPAAALDDIYIKFNKYRFSEESYITILAAVIDTDNRMLAYSNAGHSVPMLLATRGSVFELSVKGAPIANWFNTGGYKDSTFRFNGGDKLIMFTDGIADLKNKDKIEFGYQPLIDQLMTHSSIGEMKDNLQRQIEDFSSNAIDDMTVLIAKLGDYNIFEQFEDQDDEE